MFTGNLARLPDSWDTHPVSVAGGDRTVEKNGGSDRAPVPGYIAVAIKVRTFFNGPNDHLPVINLLSSALEPSAFCYSWGWGSGG